MQRRCSLLLTRRRRALQSFDDIPDLEAMLKAQEVTAPPPALTEDDIVGAAKERAEKELGLFSLKDGMKKLAYVIDTDPTYNHIPQIARTIFHNIATGVYASMSPEEKAQMAQDDLRAKMVFLNNQRGQPNHKGKYPGQKDCPVCQARGYTVGIKSGELIAHRCSCIRSTKDENGK